MKYILYTFLIFLMFSCSTEVKPKKNQPLETSVSQADTKIGDTSFNSINERIREDIQNADLYIERANIYIEKEDLTSAKYDLDRAYQIDTTALNPLIAFSDYWIKQGKLGYSLSVLEKAQRIHP